ncbi:cellulose binding domain-containing protein [Micromonospora sp. DT48]|uniref:cellulose binding domain-containing protein n=1 Tax=unclassified Micromonospora TaxID=2617518 RepID=UPI0012BCE100|nr:cellulose binding domain-containing protein [Micromonospora sp. CP22]MTK03277.1 hypothetical protein [Micromonospora sp. CP22]
MSVRPSGDANDDATGDQYGDGNRAVVGDHDDEAAGDRLGDAVGDRATSGRALSRMVASAPWVMVLAGVAVLAVLLVVALLSFRGPEQPTAWSPGPPIALPTPAGEGGESAARSTTSTGPSTSQTPKTSLTPSASTGSPTSGATSTPSTGASPSGTPAPTGAGASPSASAPTAAFEVAGALTVSYQVQGSGAGHFEAEMVVHNGTGQAEDWQVELRFASGVTGIRASSGPGVAVTIRGVGWYRLSGTGQLAAGAQQSVYLRFTRIGGGEYPAQCTVNGTPCGID